MANLVSDAGYFTNFASQKNINANKRKHPPKIDC